MRNDRGDVPGILRERRVEAASARCRCRRARSRSSCTWSKSADRTVLGLLVRLCAGEIQSRCATKGRQMTDRCHRGRVNSIGDGSARQNGCVPRPQLAQPRGGALFFPAFRRESRVSHRDRRTRRRSDAEISNPNSIPCDDRDRVHLDLDACGLFEAVLPRNNSCCFPDYVQCC